MGLVPILKRILTLWNIRVICKVKQNWEYVSSVLVLYLGRRPHPMIWQLSYSIFCLKREVWESKWEVWRSSWLYRRTLREPRETWVNLAFVMEPVMSELALDLSQNYYQTIFCSFWGANSIFLLKKNLQFLLLDILYEYLYCMNQFWIFEVF